MLGRSPLVNTPTPPTNKRKASTVGGGAKGHFAVTGPDGTLPGHLQAQLLSLLTQLLRSGRRLTPRTPVLLEEEFSLLAPDVVRLAVAAAKAAATAVARGISDEIGGKSGVAQGGGGGGGGSGGGRGTGTGDGGAAAANSADVAILSVAFLEELQMGSLPPKRISADGDDSDDDGVVLGRDDSDGLAHGGRVGMRLRDDEALALSEAVGAMAESGSVSSPPFDAHGLKTRVVALLACPGAVEAFPTPATLAAAQETSTHHEMPTWARATAHGEGRTKGSKPPPNSRSAKSDAGKNGRSAAGKAPVPAGDGGVSMTMLPQKKSPGGGDTTGKSGRKKKKSRVK